MSTDNQITEPIVDKELSVMLKEIGFDVPINQYYSNRPPNNTQVWTNVYNHNFNNFIDEYSCPSLSLCQLWLYTEKGLWVEITALQHRTVFSFGIIDVKTEGWEGIWDDDPDGVEFFNEPTEALLGGLKYACKFIAENKK